ncbi:MAG TPA: general secretion pathway protein GspB [Steroidobacteraceae bacterium]|jgi:general secretion pathway protein B|nr:general secretion pathway protein GspB [Steroidobacteraceae bacterium]
MSFILDALKKSEIERQRQSEPGLMDAGIRRRRGRLPVWAVLLGLLLAINIVVLLVMLLRNSAPTARATPAAHAAAAAAAQPGEAPHFSPLNAPPVYAPEIPVSAAAGSAAADSAPAARAPLYVAPLRAAASQAGARALHRPDPVLTDEDAGAGASASNDEVLPSISELSLTGAQTLPELHLDVHVYATKPGDRFVYINMRKYKEGAVLQEGPKIELIRRDGVVLNFQGLRFILPRQS